MKYAVVTGATKGIGRAIAERLLREGYFVIGNYASDDYAAGEFLQHNKPYEQRLVIVKQPLSSYETACALSERIVEITREIDVLVLNSGTTDRAPFGEITKEEWSRVMDVNLNAPFFLIQNLSTYMSENSGRIILIGSLMAEHPHARSVSYGVSKAAVQELARYLVKHFSPRGITVNAVSPGFADTPWQSGKEPAHRKRIEDKIALHRFARPDEVASLCMHIVENQYINGAVLNIDGGYSYE